MLYYIIVILYYYYSMLEIYNFLSSSYYMIAELEKLERIRVEKGHEVLSPSLARRAEISATRN